MNKRDTGKGRSGKPSTGRGRTEEKREKPAYGASKRSGGPSKRKASDSGKSKKPTVKGFRGEKTFGEKSKRPTIGNTKESGTPKRSFGRKNAGMAKSKNPSVKGADFKEKLFKKGFKKPSSSAKKYTGKVFKDRDKSGIDREDRPKTDNYGKPYKKREYKPRLPGRKQTVSKTAADDGLIRLNKYIANTGICSRREADDLITAGAVTVNGQVVSELGVRIDPAVDIIHYGGQLLRSEKLRYILLNKPKDYIVTTDDPQERRTIMELVKDACRERIYPVGRLDRATTGLLILTNDGELTKRLTHPRYEIKKIYHVELDQNLKQPDFEKAREGMELEDGFIKVDAISYIGETKREVGVELHSGRNRIVRRIFESMGYKINKLDRVYFGGLTKKDLPRGRWRHLTEMEINMLKMLTGNKKSEA